MSPSRCGPDSRAPCVRQQVSNQRRRRGSSASERDSRMRQKRRLPLLCLLTIASAAGPVSANDESDCFQSTEAKIRIKGCAEIIQRNPSDATAYHNRGVAYEAAGDLDRAIADYTRAIEIAPNNATAYDNRSRTYASKG